MIALGMEQAALLSEITGSRHWLITEDGLTRFCAQLTHILGKELTKIEAKASPPALTVVGDEAVIPIKGVLLDSVPWYFARFDIEATAYGDIIRQVAQAEGDGRVKSLRFDVDSPGGIVTGVAETADAIANTTKPTRAVVGGLAASAAYYLVSQADQIEAADRNGSVGSIGVFTVYYDVSARFEKEGFKAVLIRSGVHKGMGVMGAPITDEQIAAVQEEIDQIHTHFVQAVAAGRGLPEADVRELATGRTWLAPQALELKLIDAVRVGYSQTSTEAPAAAIDKGGPDMDTQNQTEAAVDAQQVQTAERNRMKELREAFPDDPQFAMAQCEKGATLIEAKAAYSDVLAERLAEKEKAEVSGTTGADAAIGAAAAEGTANADTEADFMTVARQYARDNACGMSEAMQTVRRTNKALHEKFLQGCLAQARPRAGQCERISA